VVFGKSGGFAASLNVSALNGSNGFRVVGFDNFDLAGTSVASAGDVNGDGFADMIIGCDGAGANGAGSGSSYVVFGKSGGFGSSVNLSVLDGINAFRLDGAAVNDASGHSVASAGDVNGDGYADLIVGASGVEHNSYDSGAGYVVFGKAGGFASSVNPAALNGTNGFGIYGVTAYDFAGYSVSGAGDVNGDGFADLIIGAWGADTNGASSGASYVVFGKSAGFAANLELSTLDGSNGFRLEGGDAFDQSGRAVAAAGDVNGDGFADLIVGAFTARSDSSGASYVVFGKAGGFASSLNLATLNGSNGTVLNGVAPIDNSGSAVASAGDVDGDGFADVIVGAPGSYNGSSTGYSYVYLSPATGGATYRGTSLAETLRGTPSNDVMNGYGRNDVLYGNAGHDSIDGGTGNDTITGGAGNDTLEGGAGTDTANFTGTAAQSRFGQRDGVTIISGADGVDQLTNIELVKFGTAAAVTLASVGAQMEELMLTASGGVNRYVLADLYSGPVGGVVYQWLGSAAGDVALGTTKSDFINLLGGDDAVDGGAGNDIIDGGGGSNFLTGGAGVDTFFIDGRGGTTTWSTITDWQVGEQLSIWGWKPGVSQVIWVDSAGAVGYQGVTMFGDLDGNGSFDTSVTWSGRTHADLPTPVEFANPALLWFV
jgi:Ca2+-binding RTX toxin-like protein